MKKEASGKWFAIFCAEQERKEPKINNGKQIGIDLGLKSFATLSDGKIIENPKHLKQHEEKLTQYQKLFSRKKKGSKHRLRAKHKVALLYEKIANTRADFLHKISTELQKHADYWEVVA